MEFFYIELMGETRNGESRKLVTPATMIEINNKLMQTVQSLNPHLSGCSVSASVKC